MKLKTQILLSLSLAFAGGALFYSTSEYEGLEQAAKERPNLITFNKSAKGIAGGITVGLTSFYLLGRARKKEEATPTSSQETSDLQL